MQNYSTASWRATARSSDGATSPTSSLVRYKNRLDCGYNKRVARSWRGRFTVAFVSSIKEARELYSEFFHGARHIPLTRDLPLNWKPCADLQFVGRGLSNGKMPVLEGTRLKYREVLAKDTIHINTPELKAKFKLETHFVLMKDDNPFKFRKASRRRGR